MGNVDPHRHRVEHVAVAQGVPRVLNVVFPKGDVDAGGVEFLDPGYATALWVGVKAPAEVHVDQRVGDKVDPAQLQEAEELVGVSIVVRAHRCGVAGRHPGPHLAFQGFGGQDFQVARGRVVNFVTVDVDQLVIFVGQGHQEVDGFPPVFGVEFKVGDPADHVDPFLYGLFHQFFPVGEA